MNDKNNGSDTPENIDRRIQQAKAIFAKLPMVGPVVWLYSQSPAHKHHFFADTEWLLMPPLVLNQGKLFMKDEAPMAWVSWAFLDEERERLLLEGKRRLAPHEWKSGDRLWLIDLVAPFGGAEGVVKELREKVFPTRNMHQRVPDDAPDKTKAVEWEAIRPEH